MNRSFLPTAARLHLILCLACTAPAGSATTTAQNAATPTPAARADAGGVDTNDTRMLEQPAISAEHIAFVYAGDLWVAKLDGTGVRRLTSHPGPETRPR